MYISPINDPFSNPLLFILLVLYIVKMAYLQEVLMFNMK